jgi:hypothetical protein
MVKFFATVFEITTYLITALSFTVMGILAFVSAILTILPLIGIGLLFVAVFGVIL